MCGSLSIRPYVWERSSLSIRPCVGVAYCILVVHCVHCPRSAETQGDTIYRMCRESGNDIVIV